ncbi:MAG: hypothetical protein KDI71_03235, partial [Xanthomonadales bacterium]|nr:hypothetical protein [Xanthomonadales bacterium]
MKLNLTVCYGSLAKPWRWITALALLLSSAFAVAQPTFTQSFDPDQIAPGSGSVLTYTISNGGVAGVTDLAFINVLPAGVILATGANPFSNCTDAIVDAPDGGSTIDMSEARLGSGQSCFVRVDVVATGPGTFMNVSGDLTSSAGNSGPSSDDLTAIANRPTFSKSFFPTLIQVGAISRLTFTMDGSGLTSNSFNGNFSDFLPSGLRVADFADVSTDCVGVPMVTPGASSVSLFGVFLATGSSCTLELNVVAEAAGRFDNRSEPYNSSSGNSGRANAVLNAARTSLVKNFAGPVRPGDVVELTFDIRNYDRGDDLTQLTFSDDLDAMLSGATAVGLPLNDVCGSGSQISGTSLITLMNGSLPPSGTCQFSVMVQIPAGAAQGTYPNTTSTIDGLLSAAMFSDLAATADLQVQPAPMLTKVISPATALPGDLVTVDFTLTNVDTINPATDVTFTDVVGEWLTIDQLYNLPPAGFCNGTGFASQFDVQNVRNLTISGITLAAGASCSFSVSLTLPVDFPTGSYLNEVDQVNATVNGMSISGSGAADTLNVVAAPSLSKSFADDPVNAGSLVTLEFTLSHSENAPADATLIAFTDDLNATLAGLVAVGLPLVDPCGPGSSLSGTTTLTFTGGNLAPGSDCVFNVQLQTPAGAAPGDYPNTTSTVSAFVGGLVVDGPAASDTLRIQPLVVSKRFVESPIFVGTPTVTLEFTLENLSASAAVSSIFFTDSLTTALSGLAYGGPPLMNICGAGSSIAGTTSLVFVGGSLAPGTSCTFSLLLNVPAAAGAGDYGNLTSAVSGVVGGNAAVFAPATATLQIVEPLAFAKSFIDDPTQAGGTVTLSFIINNSDPAQAISNLTFTDDLDAALPGLVATGLPMNNVCGAGSTLSGTSLMTLTGGSLPSGGSCVFNVTLQVPAAAVAGTYLNQTSMLSGISGGSPVSAVGASDSLVVAGAVDFSKSFAAEVFPGNLATIQFTLINSDTAPVSDLRFSDDLNAFLAGAVAVGLPLTDPCGPGSSLSGTSDIVLLGGNLAPMGASCSFSVDVQIPPLAAPGSYLNSTSALTSAGTPVAPAALATLGINPPPAFTKVFAASAVFVGQVSQLALIIDNSASTIAASGLDFTDNLPAGMTVATPANASTTCTGGTLTATAGSATISYTGGTVAPGAACMVNVDVVASSAGALVNTTGNLSSIAGSSGSASDSILVDPLPPFGKSFMADTIFLGETTTLQFDIDNSGSSQALMAAAFTDVLPAGVLIATPSVVSAGCVSTVTAPSGGGTITATGIDIGPGSTCTISVDVTPVVAGDFVNTASALSFSGGSSPAPSANLRVNPLPLFSKAFAPTGIPVGNVSTLTLTIDN